MFTTASLLIKNGRIWDGSRFFFADILTEEDRITRIKPDISADAAYICDAAGKTVSAGLVDIHMHMRLLPTDKYGIQTEMACFPFGVTAAADAGRTQGSREVLDSFAVKNVLFAGVHFENDQPQLDLLEQALQHFGDKAIGIKVYFDTNICQVSSIRGLARVCEFARQKGLKVMVHCSHSPTSMAEILETLNPGDILTHAFHGGENTAAEDAFTSMKAAQKRGVIIDAGFAGHIHTDFSVFRKAMAAGIVPDCIGTDITRRSAYVRGGRYGMTMCMSMAKNMGMEETEIFKAVTSRAGNALGQEWGCLKIGGTADIAVLEETRDGFSLTDRAGNHIESNTGYRCVLTVADGQIVFKD